MGQHQSKSIDIAIGQAPNPEDVFLAVNRGDIPNLRLYRPYWKSVNSLRNSSGQGLLHCAVISKKVDCIALLVQNGINIDSYDRNRNTPLMLAVEHNSTENVQIIKYLVSNGADINAGDLHGRTPLLKSLKLLNFNNASMLLRLGANTNIGDKYACYPIHLCVQKGSEDVLKQCVANDSHVNVTDKRDRTALHLSIQIPGENQSAIVDFLLQNDCKPCLMSQDGTPLQIAILAMKPAAVASLLHHGACTSTHIHQHNSYTSNYLDLGLEVLSKQLYIPTDWENEHFVSRHSTIFRALQVVNLLMPAYGMETDAAEALGAILLFRKDLMDNLSPHNHACLSLLNTILDKLAFLYAMSDPASMTLTLVHKVTHDLTLTNICRMSVRKELTKTYGSVLAVKDLLVTPSVKDILLLKDL